MAVDSSYQRIFSVSPINPLPSGEFAWRKSPPRGKISQNCSCDIVPRSRSLEARDHAWAGTPTSKSLRRSRVLQIPNAKLTTSFFAEHSRMSKGAILRRFGGWFHALGAMAETLDPARDGGLLSRIRACTAGRMGARKAVAPAPGGTLSVPDTAAAGDLALPEADGDVPIEHGTLYGDFIHFRGLVHAPINEQGVIFLFGMICRELG
jgi:hypothetical protein